ncbi:hypothetical protein [Thiolapillus sp.]|uniref:hypothetical protein n=2 Tax=Thiolapillus sp. TaxID=2017437 RepID=UPI003AF6EC22
MMAAWLPTTLFDWVILLYLCWCLLRGWRRGFYPELYAALSAVLLLAMLAGFSLTTVLWRSLDHLLNDYLHLSRLLGLLLLLGLMVWLLWKIRAYLTGLEFRVSNIVPPYIFG